MMPRKPRNDDLKEAIEVAGASDLASEEKAEIIDGLKADYRRERAKIKAQPKERVQRARRILSAQLEQLQARRDPMEPIKSADGSHLYGTNKGAILFKANGTVSLIRGSQSLKAEWKSIAGRLGALDKTIAHEVPQVGALLDPVVFELASMPVDLNLADTVTALREILSEDEKHRFERKRDKLLQQITAAWTLRHKDSDTHQPVLEALQRLAQELGRPPTKGELGRRLELTAQRTSQLCKELGYDWLPTDKPWASPQAI